MVTRAEAESVERFTNRYRLVRLRALLIVTAALMWVLAGWGHNALTVECYESRHSIDREPIVAPGLLVWAIDVAFWPLFTVADILNAPDCSPRPLAP